MSRNIAGEIEKEYGDYAFRTPLIRFGYNKIEIAARPQLYEKIILIASIAIIVLFLVYIKSNFLFFSGIILAILSIYMFLFISRFRKTEIDFLNSEIRVDNLWRISDLPDKLFKKKKIFPFTEIAGFKNLTSREWKEMRKNSLVVVLFDHPPVKIAAFSFERDSRRMGELLFKYIKRPVPRH